MILYYVRHGDPIYDPNQLTPLGHRQAEAAAKRLAAHGIDQIFTSPSNRARQTAQPLCELTKQEATVLEWADEDLLYRDLSMMDTDGHRHWCFRHSTCRLDLSRGDVRPWAGSGTPIRPLPRLLSAAALPGCRTRWTVSFWNWVTATIWSETAITRSGTMTAGSPSMPMRV